MGEAGCTQDAFDKARGTIHTREEVGSERTDTTEAVVTRCARGPATAPVPSSSDRSPVEAGISASTHSEARTLPLGLSCCGRAKPAPQATQVF